MNDSSKKIDDSNTCKNPPQVSSPESCFFARVSRLNRYSQVVCVPSRFVGGFEVFGLFRVVFKDKLPVLEFVVSKELSGVRPSGQGVVYFGGGDCVFGDGELVFVICGFSGVGEKE